MDNLENFITQNRDAFDDSIPSLKVWAAIDRTANKKHARRIRLWKQLQIAAAITVLLVSGGIVGSYLTQSGQGNSAMAILQQAAPEYFEMEQYFKTQIDDRINQLVSYSPNDQVLQDLDQIDQAMLELKAELQDAPKGKEDEIIENLIQNYQMKVAILEKVLERMQLNSHTKNNKTEDDEISI
jgi:phosphoglycerate-specific signal transduction histidine kinase